jgi:ATP-binding cassette subfamily B (MDR/TAP) protein 1
MSTARTKGDIDNATIDMTQNHPVSFLKTVAYIASGSRRLKHISGVNIMVCVITGAIYPSQAFIFGHEVVSFQKSPADMVRSIEFWSWMFFVLSLISLVSFSTLGILSSIGGTITSRVFRERYFRGLLDQPMAFFDKSTNTPGLLVSPFSVRV